jgi:PadR family transcriptional regulator PadR
VKLRVSRQTLQVLNAFLEDPPEWKHGYGISQTTGLKSGTLYPILMRLAERKLLETSWDASEIGKPPRHLYRLTAAGLQFAREGSRSRPTGRVSGAALGGMKS